MKEEKEKSEIRLRAEMQAKEICEVASEAHGGTLLPIKYDDLVLRLEKSFTRAQEKRDFEKYMKDGVRFVTENSDKISMYKIVRYDFKCIIGVGIMATDDSRMKFTTAVCICAPPDFDRWSDKTAKGYIGNRLREFGYGIEIEYDYNIDEKNIVNGIQLRILSDALLNFSGPSFFKKNIKKERGDIICGTNFSIERIMLGNKGMASSCHKM